MRGVDMLIPTVPRPKKAKPDAYGEGVLKKPFQFMLTEESSDKIDDVADKLGITRSEVLERMIRCNGLSCAEHFDPETGKCKP